MILEMNKISVFGLHRDRKEILETLHKQEVVEVCEPEAEEICFKETEKSITQFDKYMKSAEAALAVLDEYIPEKSGFFAGRRTVPMQRYHMASSDNDVTLRAIHDLLFLSDKIKEKMENIRRINIRQSALLPYLALDISMSDKETSATLIESGSLGGVWTAESLQKKIEDWELHSLHFEILSTSREYTYLWLVFPKLHKERVNEFLQQIGFSRPSFDPSRHTPKIGTQALEQSKNVLEKEIQGYISKIKKYDNWRHDIELFYDHMSLRSDKYQVLSKMGMMDHTFLLEGYIPKKYGKNVKQLLEEKWAAYVELKEPDELDDVPIAFQNNAFAAPVEGITETYSMPSSCDIDPNPIMSFFYYLFFGMMFSDAGYGMLLMLVCGYLGFGKRLEKQKQKSFRMFFFCGVSTVFWGIMYGSFFGNIIYTISDTFFGKEIVFSPIWLDPISDAMRLMVFSVALGMIQILVGLGIKFYTLCRQKQVRDALFDVGLWMMALVGICLLAAGILTDIPAMTNAGAWVAVLGAVGLVLTGGRKSKSIVGKMLGGVAGLYNITGYMSDALSYCRLMALGLATGSISNVVNMLGAMFGSSAISVILFIIIAVFGHGLNFAMNMLGAYVHTNRLQYVEFFSKFYEGGGRKFSPLQMRTKYHQFAEK